MVGGVLALQLKPALDDVHSPAEIQADLQRQALAEDAARRAESDLDALQKRRQAETDQESALSTRLNELRQEAAALDTPIPIG